MLRFLDSHAGAIQAICAAIALLIAIIGTILVIQSVRAARKQASAAADQIALLQAQYRESLRPVIVVSVEKQGEHYLALKLANDGSGPALSVNGPFTRTTNLLGAKSTAIVGFIYDQLEDGDSVKVTVSYKSIDGRCFESIVMIYSGSNCLHHYREVGV